jgi:hypothetical protein
VGLNTLLMAIRVTSFIHVLYENENMLYETQNVKDTQILMKKEHKLKSIYFDGILNYSKWRDGKDWPVILISSIEVINLT